MGPSEAGSVLAKGSGPPCELKGSGSPRPAILEAKGSESGVSFALELKGSLAVAGGAAVVVLLGCELKGSGPDAVLLGCEAKGSASGAPPLPLNGSAEPNGSTVGKGAAGFCLKKASEANGSEPLKGSPPKGSGMKYIERVRGNISIDNQALLTV